MVLAQLCRKAGSLAGVS